MGSVYVAEHTYLRRYVAIKLLHVHHVAHPELAVRFEQEACATNRMEHDNIVRVIDFGRPPAGELYLVMELLEGRSLGELLAAEPRLAPRRALDITRQVLAGLEAAHTSGVIHRDLKPDNVFLAVRP